MTELSTAVSVAPAVPEFAPPSRARASTPALSRRVLARRVRAEELRLARLRLYSYCLTLTACVFALMSFMYLVQGTADGDASFTALGVLFVALTGASLWSAVRVTRIPAGGRVG